MRAWPGRQQGVPGRRKHEQGLGVLATQGPGRNHGAREGAGQGAREAGGPWMEEMLVLPGYSVQEPRGRGRRCIWPAGQATRQKTVSLSTE